MQAQDGMNYAPQGKPAPVCEKGDFSFAAVGLDHGHIYGMCNGLIEAGGQLKWVYDPDPAKVNKFLETYPEIKAARSEQEVLQDPDVRLVAGAAITSERCDLGMRVMSHGKDYFTDKAPFTTLAQLEQARQKAAETGLKYAVYYSERVHVESAVYAGQLIERGAIGRVLQVSGYGPHRINVPSRPGWFFNREQFGGILCDIGSHQCEQFLFYTGSKDAKVVNSQVANYNHKQFPTFEDFGDCNLVGDNGSTGYFRVDWFTPNGLSTWGDGRTIILGTDGYIELRKYVDIAREKGGGHVYLVNHEGEHYFNVSGKIGYPFFGELIMDCLNRTEIAMTQEHAFKAAELCLTAQRDARLIEGAWRL
ncbi:Gfo/Idh/MocA family oxidoreductase [Paenibacillus sp. GD4]|uniref:Gfo/Idh/MocA family protein n=1 Tax=Paenibacillus sp. GD4 TaxID=3068890 RepID=UPI002796B8C5|nr:Gfo/Idh/MocA family oxidoreductase [Paenibacillus sp. GD4]MDQ1908981.1 Gfo/Idh/MocA family oxidoreductase [Paenibacillus sp. GD4]